MAVIDEIKYRTEKLSESVKRVEDDVSEASQSHRVRATAVAAPIVGPAITTQGSEPRSPSREGKSRRGMSSEQLHSIYDTIN